MPLCRVAHAAQKFVVVELICTLPRLLIDAASAKQAANVALRIVELRVSKLPKQARNARAQVSALQVCRLVLPGNRV